MYPKPASREKSLTVGAYTLRPDDYLNYERETAFGETVYSGCYVIDVDPDEGTVEFFNLKEEARVTHTADELEAVLGETLHHTGETWTEGEP